MSSSWNRLKTMRRPSATSNFAYSFGPGPVTPAIKLLIIANVTIFLITALSPTLELVVNSNFGLQPRAIFENLRIWQPATYMFLHAGIFHILFNMLMLWMFGVELERMWGSRYFTKFYFVSGVGAALTTVGLSLTPLPFAEGLYHSLTIGASGAIYGVLLAYALYFPHRPIYLYFVFPIPARYFVLILGGIALVSSVGSSGSGVAHTAHLGGLVVGYLYLKGLRIRPLDELKYRYLRWKMGRARSRFDVYSGGRSPSDDEWKSEWKKHIH